MEACGRWRRAGAADEQTARSDSARVGNIPMRLPYFSSRMAGCAGPLRFPPWACASRMSSRDRVRCSRSRWRSKRSRKKPEPGNKEQGSGITGDRAAEVDALPAIAVYQNRLAACSRPHGGGAGCADRGLRSPSATVRQGHWHCSSAGTTGPKCAACGEIFFPDAEGHWPVETLIAASAVARRVRHVEHDA